MYENSDVLFKIDLWELALQKLEEIPVLSNPLDDDENGMGNINMKKNKKDGLDDENSTVGTNCCLSKIEKLAVPTRVALLQSTNIWVGDLGVSVHCLNDRVRGSNIHQGSGTGTIGEHGDAMTARSIMDTAGTWCNKFSEEQLKATLKDVQYNPKSNFKLFSIGKAIKEGWKLSGEQEGLVLMKGNVKLAFNIKIMTKNGVIFCAYLQREHEIGTILAITSTIMSIEKAHIMTGLMMRSKHVRLHWNWDGF